MNRLELKSKAKEQLRGRWGVALITVFVANLIINSSITKETIDFFGEFSSSVSISINIISLLFGGVISVGLSKFLLNFITNNEEPQFKDLFSNFNIYFKTLGLYILMMLAIGIATLFLIIPGIIVALMFSQAFYILAEDPSKGIFECLEESSNIMSGHKWDFFVLELSFIGWWLLAILTFGIAGLWISPYQNLTEANFYLSLKNYE
ncbi:DUF975 family protein [Clostridium sp. CTA-7]